MTDLYEALGVERDATPEEIAAAGRKAAKEHHPDKGGDPDKFHAVSRAMAVLRDAAKREKYDRDGLDDSGPSADQMALQILSQHFAILLTKAMDFTQVDVVNLMLVEIENQITHFQAQVHAANDHLRRLALFKKRLKRRDKKASPLHKMLEAQERETRARISSAESMIAAHKEAKAMAEAYDWETDPPTAFVNGGYAGVGNTTGGSWFFQSGT